MNVVKNRLRDDLRVWYDGMILELKVDDTPETALRQIREKICSEIPWKND